jgi:hypothetical protein
MSPTVPASWKLYMPDVTPLVTTHNGEFYTQNASPTPWRVDPPNPSSGLGSTCQPQRTKSNVGLRPVRASRAPDDLTARAHLRPSP